MITSVVLTRNPVSAGFLTLVAYLSTATVVTLAIGAFPTKWLNSALKLSLARAALAIAIMPSAKHPADLNGLVFMAFVRVIAHGEAKRFFPGIQAFLCPWMPGLSAGNHRS